ncbi:MAG: ABC transporter substrate-binding protein [Synechococcales cyanobacterium T60_A2020_003]|nr:ABC transporter substrate-binding protein [Synechococcales cyanobacterium T60_A2020_003]
MIRPFNWRSLGGITLGILALISAYRYVSRHSQPPVEPPAIIRDGLRVGVILPMTGSYSVVGKPLATVFPLLMRKVNACGGVNAAPVMFILKDDRSDSTVASRAMVELAFADNVQALVGGITSAAASEMVKNLERLEVPIVSPASTSIDIPIQARNWKYAGLYWARTIPSDADEAKALADLAIARSITSIAIVAIDDEYGRAFARTFTSAFQNQGGTIATGDTPIFMDGRSPTPEDPALAERLAEADAVLIIAYPDSGGPWLREALAKKLLGDRQLLLTSSVYTPRFLEAIGSSAENNTLLQGALGLTPGTNSSAYLPLKTLWEGQEGYAPPAFAAQTWDAAALVLLAAEASGQNSSQGIAKELRRVANPPGIEVSDICRGLELVRRGEDINYQGASGSVDLDANGNVTGQYDVWTVDDQGRFDVLYSLK